METATLVAIVGIGSFMFGSLVCAVLCSGSSSKSQAGRCLYPVHQQREHSFEIAMKLKPGATPGELFETADQIRQWMY